MLDKILKSFGLSEKESTVYLSSLRVPSSKIQTIANRAGFSRSTTYNILHSLLKKGLVQRFDKGSIQYFTPIPPSELINVLEKKKEDLTGKIEMVKAYLPQFESIYNAQAVFPKVSFYEGISGIKQVYQDILKKGNKNTSAVLSLGNVSPELKKWMIKSFTPKKIKRNISSRVLVSSKNLKSYLKLDKKHLRDSLVIPHKKYPFEVEIDVYDDNKTAFISFDETELMGVIIESKKIANTLKSLFELAWKSRLAK